MSSVLLHIGGTGRTVRLEPGDTWSTSGGVLLTCVSVDPGDEQAVHDAYREGVRSGRKDGWTVAASQHASTPLRTLVAERWRGWWSRCGQW